MADYYAILKKAIGALPDSTGEARRAVYEKARQALVTQLKSFDPPLSATEITQQRLQLEDCIRRVEAEAAKGILSETLTRSAQSQTPSASDGLSGLRNLRESEARRVPPGPRPTERPYESPRATEARGLEPRATEMRPTEMRTLAPRPTEMRAPDVRPRDLRAVEMRQPEPRTTAPAPIPRPVERPTELRTRPMMEPPRPAPTAAPAPTGPSGLDRLRARPVEPPAPEPATSYSRPTAPAVAPVPPPVAPLPPMPQYEDTYGAVQGQRAPQPAADDDYHPGYGATAPEPNTSSSAFGYAQPPHDDAQANEEALTFAEFDDAARTGTPDEGALAAEHAFGPRRKGRGPAIAAAVAGVLVVGLGVVVWAKREDIVAYLGVSQTFLGTSRTATDKPLAKSTDRLSTDDPAGPRAEPGVRTVTTQPIAPTDAPQAGAPAPAPAPAAPPVASAPPLPPVAPGPSTTTSGSATPGVAAAPPLPTQPVPLVAQRVTLQEEGVGGPGQVQLSQGKVVWQMVKESPAAGKPPVAILRARVDIPDRKMSAVISIQPNSDPSFSASHLVELKFTTAPDFDGKGIGNVPGLILKPSEQQRGDRLEGASAKIASGFFWIALSANDADRVKNLQMLKERGWIDIPIVYDTGRRAVLTLEKAGAGDRIFNDVLAAWGQGG